MMIRLIRKLLTTSFLFVALTDGAIAQSEIVSWGSRAFNSALNHEVSVGVAAGGYHSAARRAELPRRQTTARVSLRST